MSRYADELADATTVNRLRKLDNFTGGNQAAKQSDELREALGGNSRGSLSNRLNRADDGPSGSLDNSANCRFNSFTAETLVHTDEGQKPIEDIKEGDKVLAEDPATGEQGYFEVVALTNHPEAEILQITVEDETQAEAQTEAKAETEDIDNLDTEAQDTDNDTQQLNNDNSPSPHHLNVTADHPIYIEGQGTSL